MVNDDACTDLIQRCSASLRSVVFKLVSSSVLSFRTRFLNFFANLITRAVTRSRLVNLWNRLMSISCSILFSRVSSELFTSECVIAGGFSKASSRATLSSDCVDRFTGHSDFGRLRNAAPFHQVVLVESSLADKPREGISAEFHSPGQCLHSSLEVNFRISSTRCWTYCFHTSLFLIQRKAVIESVQLIILIVSLLELNLWTSRARRTAPGNSSRGMDCFFNSATRDFEATKRTKEGRRPKSVESKLCDLWSLRKRILEP